MAKLSIDEKRLKSLREQLYGKERKTAKKFSAEIQSTDNSKIEKSIQSEPVHLKHPTNKLSQSNFVGQDLSKIFILSSIAIGTQLILYFALQKGIVNFSYLNLLFR